MVQTKTALSGNVRFCCAMLYFISEYDKVHVWFSEIQSPIPVYRQCLPGMCVISNLIGVTFLLVHILKALSQCTLVMISSAISLHCTITSISLMMNNLTCVP